jgi:phytoene synthase
MSAESVGYAAEFLKANDRDRYFATLLLGDKHRAAVTALYAFSADVASVRDRAREPAAGEIRLQWWTDALTGDGHGAVRQNPLADALLDAISEYGLPVPPFTRLITARRFDLYDDPMPDVPTFEGYAGETTSALYQLAAMILNGGKPVETGDAAGHLGVAHALIGHLRAFGYYASQGRVFLPWSVFAANGVKEADVFSGTASTGLSAALAQLTELAGEHLRKANAAVRELPAPLRPVLAHRGLLAMQLRRLSLETPFQRQTDLADWRKIVQLWLSRS